MFGVAICFMVHLLSWANDFSRNMEFLGFVNENRKHFFEQAEKQTSRQADGCQVLVAEMK